MLRIRRTKIGIKFNTEIHNTINQIISNNKKLKTKYILSIDQGTTSSRARSKFEIKGTSQIEFKIFSMCGA
jgi:hypothetical protein